VESKVTRARTPERDSYLPFAFGPELDKAADGFGAVVAESHQADGNLPQTNHFDCAGRAPLHGGIRAGIDHDDSHDRNFYLYEYWYSSSSRSGGLSLGFSKSISQRHVSHGSGSGRLFGKGICSAVGGSLTPTDACDSGACLRIAAAARSKTAFASPSALER
jgi:hypothetical protein